MLHDRIERWWVSILDSSRMRRLTRRGGAGAALLRSPGMQKFRLALNSAASYYSHLTHPATFRDLHTLCLFVGHNKSGTSMLGALLDAHPDIILADGVGALGYVSAGFRREQIFHLLLRGSRRELLKGRVTARRLTPYSYLVPGQWQGRYQTLRVIGDGTAGSSTQRFAQDPTLLARLHRTMRPVQVKFIQIIRNPFDPISVMMVRGNRSFEYAIDYYFSSCATLVELRSRLNSESLFPLRYEDFVRAPVDHLTRLCRYLGVEPHADYLQACASILHPTPDQNRQMVPWDAHWIKVVEDHIQRFDFLAGYTYDYR